MVRFGFCALAVEALLLTISPLNADTPDPNNPFTKHGLPVPGAYFTKKQNSQPPTVAVSKSANSAQNPKPANSKANKRPAKDPRYANT